MSRKATSTFNIPRITPTWNAYTWSSRGGQLHTWKKHTPWTSRSSTFFWIIRQIDKFSANFRPLNMQIRNNSKNVIFIACKLCKICEYYVYSIVISLSPVKRKKKNAIGLNIWFTLFCCNFKFVVICGFFFFAKSVFPKFQSS